MPPIHGRGASVNPPNRFETIHYEPDPDADPNEEPAPATRFLRDGARSLITYNESPDVGFDASINPYRGCEHGCVYCYARPTHEYLGFSAGLDFETRILVKEDAPELLRRELSERKWKPQPLAVSGVTDPYQPVERRLRLVRRCLEVLVEFRNPVVVITKNHLVTRDADLLGALAALDAAVVNVSVTTLREEVARVMEPRASAPARRLDAIRTLADAGIPVRVLVAPVIPGLTDHELPAIVAAARAAGASGAGYVALRLPHAVKDLFERWLEEHFPRRKDKVLHRIRSMRGGKLNDPSFGARMRGQGEFADEIRALFQIACRKARMPDAPPRLSTAGFRRAGPEQLSLFEG